MSFSINQILLAGNVGQEPQFAYTASGLATLKFSVATSEKKKDSTESVTTWHRVVSFGKMAEYWNTKITKGSKVVVQGKVQIQKYKDAQGIEKESYQVIAQFIEVGMKSPSASTTTHYSKPPMINPSQSGDDFGDLPF